MHCTQWYIIVTMFYQHIRFFLRCMQMMTSSLTFGRDIPRWLLCTYFRSHGPEYLHPIWYQTETSGQNASPSEQSRILENQANVSDSTQSKRSLNSNHETAAFTAFHKPNAYQSDYSEAAPQPNSAGQYIPNSKPHAYKKPNDHRPWHSYQNEAETEHQVIRPVPYKEPTTLHKPEGFSSQYHPERPVYKPAKAEHPKFNGVHKTVPYLSQYGSAPIHPLNKPDPYQEHQYHPYSNQHQSPLDYHPFETNSYKEPDFHKPSSPSTYSTHHKPEPEYLGEFKPTTFESSYNTKPKYSFPYKPDSYETSHNPHSDDVGVPLYRPKAQKPYQHSIVSGNIKPYHHSTYPYSQSHHEPKPEYHAAHKPTSYEPPYKPHDYYGDVPVYWPKLQKGENYASPYHRPDHLLNFR